MRILLRSNLLNHVGLEEGLVLDRRYGILARNQMTWTAMLSAVRGEVIHKGFLRIKDRQDLKMWFWFARHLHDLCTRLVLREINYGGQCHASTNPWQGNYVVDRIGANATLKELGFSQVPTHLYKLRKKHSAPAESSDIFNRMIYRNPAL